MGLFSDTCHALIDKTTGRALTGDELLAAQQDPKWPVCGNKVSKRARFCNACGKPAPGGWWKCPSCGKWIGNDSRFCPHCNQPLYPDDRAAMAGGVWSKEAGLFAQRFEVGDVKRLLNNDLLIQEGTCAILLDAGKISGILEAGRHKPDSLARRINWFGNPPPRSMVLVDVGEIVVPLRIEGLQTSERFPIEFYGEVMLRFGGTEKAADAFISNILGPSRTCTFPELSDNFIRAVRIAVDEMCTASTLDDLVRDPERRIRLQERMSSRLKADLAACGLELVRVSSAEFSGSEYNQYAAKLAEVEIARRDAEYRAALRKVTDADEMGALRDKDAMLRYKATLDAEFRVDEAKREREFELLKREYSHDDEKYRRLTEMEALQHRQALENAEVDHDLAKGRKLDEYGREKKVEDTRAEVTAQDLRATQELKEAEAWLKIREQKNKIAQDDKAADAMRRRGMTLNEMLLETNDPETRAALIEALRLQRNVNMTPEQLLAEMGKEATNDRLVAKIEELHREAAAREDRNLSKMLEPAIEAAKHPTQTVNPIIK